MIQISLELLSPLVVAENRDENLMISSDYISGSTLRGALAAIFLKSKLKGDTKTFEDFFLNDKVYYGNCYPGLENSQVIPNTARTCKSFKGFLDTNQSSTFPRHGVFDCLIRNYAYLQSLNLNTATNYADPGLFDCVDCDSPIEKISGFYSQNSNGYFQPVLSKAIITRTALDEQTQTAKTGALFSIEVIQPQQSLNFHGTITTYDDNIEKSLCVFLNNKEFSIGGERTYGYGKVKIIKINCIPKTQNLTQRFDAFNAAINKIINSNGDYFFVLTLNADVIIVDKFFRYLSQLNHEVLKTYYPSNEVNFELVESYFSTRYIQGWSNVHRLPKENELAIEKGGVFLFKVDKNIDKQKLIDYLTQIEINGIGERKSEGFGEVVVCHSFHLEVKPI